MGWWFFGRKKQERNEEADPLQNGWLPHAFYFQAIYLWQSESYSQSAATKITEIMRLVKGLPNQAQVVASEIVVLAFLDHAAQAAVTVQSIDLAFCDKHQVICKPDKTIERWMLENLDRKRKAPEWMIRCYHKLNGFEEPLPRQCVQGFYILSPMSNESNERLIVKVADHYLELGPN